MLEIFQLVPICVIILMLNKTTHAQDSYSRIELEILPEFRALMENDVKHDYMLENKYLIRFLRARNLKLEDAQHMFQNMLKWREKFDIDNILSRDFSEFERKYPIRFTLDKTGRPAGASAIGLLNPRQLLLTGRYEQLRDYFHFLYEKGIQNLHHVSNTTGKEFIEAYLLANMAGYNLRSHGCLQCLAGWIEIALGYETHYPQLAHKIIIVNTPKIFDNVLKIIKPFLTPHTANAIHLYGHDRSEWSKVFLDLFDADQLLVEFGGTAKHKPVKSRS